MSVGLLMLNAPQGTEQTVVQAAFDACDGDLIIAELGLWYQTRANMLSSPTKWAADGDYSEDNTANLKAVEQHIARLEDKAGLGVTEPARPRTGQRQMVRTDRNRLFIDHKSSGAVARKQAAESERTAKQAKLAEVCDAVLAAMSA